MIWDEEHCKATWLVMLRMRYSYSLDVDPCISSAFILLQKYILSSNHVDYNLYILVITAFLVSCKNNEVRCDIRDLYTSFALCCQEYFQIFSESRLAEIFQLPDIGTRNEITDEEEQLVTKCELDFLESLNYETDVDLPYFYLKEHIYPHVNFGSEKENSDFKMNLEKIASAFIPTVNFFKVPPQVIACISAMSVYKSRGKEIPAELKQWFQDVKKQFTCDAFVFASEILKEQVQMLSGQHRSG